MTRRPFHHGNLRAELLERAEVVLRERGVDSLSLRELAREAGVSHGAPRNHFRDRDALLLALVERGFTRLADRIRPSAGGAEDPIEALRAAARAYLDFTTRESALLGLMAAVKSAPSSDEVERSAASVFQVTVELVDAAVGRGALGEEALQERALLFSATAQGVSAFAAAGRIDIDQATALLDNAIDLLAKP